MTLILLVVLCTLIVYKLYGYFTTKPLNIPPGLPRLPVVGSYWHLLWGNYAYPHKTVEYYVKKLNSKILSCYFGGLYAVIVNDYDTVKEVLTREEFDGRLTEVHIAKARAFGKTLGIFFTDGSQWQEQRRFALRHMRDFGFGRRHEKFENDIMDEIVVLIDTLKHGPINDEEKTVLRDGCALFPDIFYSYAANSIWLIMFGEKFPRSEHSKLREFGRAAMLFQRVSDTTGGAIVQFPFLKHFGDLFGYTSIIKGNTGLVDFVKENLTHHKRSHDGNHDRGFIDRYLEELKNHEEPSTFTEEQLIMTLVDLMFPAISAMPAALVHGIKILLHHQEVLRKVQQEIDDVVGTGRYVTWDDRKSLPYTEATIREILRYETLTPFSVFHKTLKDTTLCGYSIPKDTAIVTNLAGMHHDPDVWGDPENFRPDRFLKENGELGKDYSFSFGFGHRVCAGETFARYNVFGVFANLMQNLNFSFVEGQPMGLDDKLPGLIVTPKDTWIRVEARRS